MSPTKKGLTENFILEENYESKANSKIDKIRRVEDFKISTQKGECQNVSVNRPKCDELRMTPFGDTTCCIKDRGCKKKNCTGKWIKMERHFWWVSKVVALYKSRNNYVISLTSTNGSGSGKPAGINKNRFQNVGKIRSAKPPSQRKNKNIKGHVIFGTSLKSLNPFLASPRIVMTHILLAIFMPLIFAIESRMLPTIGINNQMSFEDFSTNLDVMHTFQRNSNSSTKFNQFNEYSQPLSTVKTNKGESAKTPPYFNNIIKIFQTCHNCDAPNKGQIRITVPKQTDSGSNTYQSNYNSNGRSNSKGLGNWEKSSLSHRIRRETDANKIQKPQVDVHQMMSSDEENDAKLWMDMVESMRQWQQRKLLKERQIKSGHYRKRRDEEIVCYADVGCFRDDGPFNYLDMLPSPPEEVNTQMLLYTRRNRGIPEIIDYGNVSGTIPMTKFNISAPLIIIIHGFGSSCQRVWPSEMRIALLAVVNVNVICVDWSAGAADPNYVRAAVNTRLVGKQLAILIESINRHFKTNINGKTHLVGFSLGAHVAGFAGDHLKNLSRITGLDPAGPLFEGYEPSVRLDKMDAAYVDVIHSNGESLIVGGFGTWEPIGHVDFYPNGGRAQKGCQHLIIGGLYDFIYPHNSPNETSRYLCNHRRAYRLFTDSISPKCSSTAFPCESYEKFERGECFSCGVSLNSGQHGLGNTPLTSSCGQMGYYSNKAAGRGSLYLLTRDEEPFCGKQFKIILTFSGSRGIPLQTYGRLQITLIDKNGLNETFALTVGVDDLLTSGTQLEKLIVTHPAIDPVSVHLLYVAYEGWIYTGRPRWKIDKLTIINEHGGKLSACRAPPLSAIIPSTPAPNKSKLLSTTAAPKELAGFDTFSSTSTSLNEFTSKYTTLNVASSSSPPPSVLAASVTSLSAPAPPVDKPTSKSDAIPPTPKFEPEGKLLPILRSGIPQSIQLAVTDCEISHVDYYPHFSGTKFSKKPPYLHNNLYHVGSGKYPNGISSNKKYTNVHYNQGISKESINALIANHPPPPPPPPTPKSRPNFEHVSVDKSKLHLDEGSSSDTFVKIVTINDHVAPISIPPIQSESNSFSDPIVVSTKLKPPPPEHTLSSTRVIDLVQISDSVAPESIPENHVILSDHESSSLLANKNEGQKNSLHPASHSTTYYTVVNNDNKDSNRHTYNSRHRPWNIPGEFNLQSNEQPIMTHKWNHLGKFSSSHNINSNGYSKYQFPPPPSENPKWPHKPSYFGGSHYSNAHRRPTWPPINQQHHNSHYHHQANVQDPFTPLYPQNSYHPNSNTYTQLPYQVQHHNINSKDHSNNDASNVLDVGIITKNNITLEKRKNATATTEATTLLVPESPAPRVTMHHLSSDEQLTILRVNQNEDSLKKEVPLKEIVSSSNTTSRAHITKSMNNDTITSSTTIEDKINSTTKSNEERPPSTGKDTKHQNANVTSDYSTVKKDDDKVDYIVLHKLPNGGALDLENMKTYTMLDLESEIAQKSQKGGTVIQEEEELSNNHLVSMNSTHGESRDVITPLTRLTPPSRSAMPRSIDKYPNRYAVNKPNELNTHDAGKSRHETTDGTLLRNKDEGADPKTSQETKHNTTNENIPEHEVLESYMSETPEDIDKLKALVLESEKSKNKPTDDSIESNPTSPMYIITEEVYMKHKPLLRQNKEGNKKDLQRQQYHFSHSESTDQEALSQKKTTDEGGSKNILSDLHGTETVLVTSNASYNNSHSETLHSTQKGEESQPSQHGVTNDTQPYIKRMDNGFEYHWTPIPQEEHKSTKEQVVFGPQLPPEGYITPEEEARRSLMHKPPIDIGEIDELSKIAYLTLTDNEDKLAENVRAKQVDKTGFRTQELIEKKDNETIIHYNEDNGLMNVQLLPPRLSAVLTHVNQHLPPRSTSSVAKITPPLNPPERIPSSKERSIGHNTYAPSYGNYVNGMFRQNKIAPIFKEDEMHIFTSTHKTPVLGSFSQGAAVGQTSEHYSRNKAVHSPKPFNSYLQNHRNLPTAKSEPRSYTAHGRQHNARRINYPSSSNHQYPPSPYQTQIVPGGRDPLRYIPLHGVKAPVKKYPPPPPLWWRSRQHGFHGRLHQHKHQRLPQKYQRMNANIFKPLPTYATVEISRSNARKVPQKRITIQPQKIDKRLPLPNKMENDLVYEKAQDINGHFEENILDEQLLEEDTAQHGDTSKHIYELIGSNNPHPSPKKEITSIQKPRNPIISDLLTDEGKIS